MKELKIINKWSKNEWRSVEIEEGKELGQAGISFTQRSQT